MCWYYRAYCVRYVYKLIGTYTFIIPLGQYLSLEDLDMLVQTETEMEENHKDVLGRLMKHTLCTIIHALIQVVNNTIVNLKIQWPSTSCSIIRLQTSTCAPDVGHLFKAIKVKLLQ